MLDISIITIHPDFINAYKQFGVFKSAEKKGLAHIKAINLRDYATDKHGSIDAPPYGGGDGMVMRPEPLRDAIKDLNNPHVIYTSPSGKKWTQKDALRLLETDRPLVFISGRFGGIDQRFVDKYVHEEFSLGDFVLSGGELPSLTMVDSILRFIPNVLGNNESAKNDSFSTGCDNLLEAPLYTRPQEFEGESVPKVLTSGDHKKINEWRKQQSLEKTKKLRNDLLK